ncbi:MAG: DUF1264 domain-containing protein [Candidatus Eremiobacteraeota bacterium]|nr:DUF1264 domain-containing protein [Candidatus Eremiobacteraeota bacterium]
MSRKATGLACILALLILVGFALAAGGGRPATAAPASGPATGWTIHIDAQKHFTDHPSEWAHHWCKAVAAGMFECQIYSSDKPDAQMVGVETIVGPDVYKAFAPEEQAKWHYHKTEIPKVNAKLPGMSAADQKKLVAQMMPTYGKVYILWDPMTSKTPIGDPTLTILK